MQSARQLDDFSRLKHATHGMLSAEVYSAMYEASLRERGDVIDVGTGRGGTSIAYAWGIEESGRPAVVHAIDQFSQWTARGPHRYTKKTNPTDCVELNVAEFRSNVEAHGVRDLVLVWPGTTDAVAPRFPDGVSAGILSIDVDGLIDRDLLYFYDHVRPDGLIIIDDCADLITSAGRKNMAQHEGWPAEDIRAWLAKLSQWRAARLLGKHLLTYMLAQYFESIGAITPIHKAGTSTVFFRKTQTAPLRSLDLAGLDDVKTAIADRYVALCSNVRA